MANEETTTRVSREVRSSAALSETRVRQALARGDVREAAASTLALYGAEIFGFIVGIVDAPEPAREVYARFAERVWGIDAFGWYCSLRTWCYALARAGIARHRTEMAERTRESPSGSARLGRPCPVSGGDGGGDGGTAARRVWTLQSPVRRDGVAALRAELAPEDLEILVLRVDRALSWREVALTVIGHRSERDVERESARLRLRFLTIRQQLARAAAAHGITPRSEPSDGKLEAAEHARVVELRRR